VDKGTL
jgi:hypothetical protein